MSSAIAGGTFAEFSDPVKKGGALAAHFPNLNLADIAAALRADPARSRDVSKFVADGGAVATDLDDAIYMAIVLLGYSPNASPTDIAVALRDPRVFPDLTARQMARTLHDPNVFPRIDAAGLTAALAGAGYGAAETAAAVAALFPSNTFALRMNGVDQYVGFAGIPATPQISVECRVRASAYAPGNWQNAVLSKHGEQSGWELRIGQGLPRMMVTVNGVHYYAQPPEPRDPSQIVPVRGVGTWFHLAGTFDGTTVVVYVDGTPIASTRVSGSITDFVGAHVMLGRNANPSWDSRYFAGDVTEVRIWDNARSQAQIVANMGGTLPGPQGGLLGWWPMTESGGSTLADHSGNGRNGDVVGAAWIPVN